MRILEFVLDSTLIVIALFVGISIGVNQERELIKTSKPFMVDNSVYRCKLFKTSEEK